MTALSRGWSSRTCRAAPSSTTRRPGPDRTTPATCSTASWSWPSDGGGHRSRRAHAVAEPRGRQPPGCAGGHGGDRGGLPGGADGLMPRRDDIRKILLLGSGPIVIGQAAEFDYSGVQACKVLLADAYEVVLVNSNPATIMTDPEFADRTYVEPLLPANVARIVERERPDVLLPTLGGQTALNLAKDLHDDGTLGRLGVELIGANYEAIHRAEDREAFRTTIEDAGLRVPWSTIVSSVSEV